jgi:polyisoprenoid-binding protein YceI
MSGKYRENKKEIIFYSAFSCNFGWCRYKKRVINALIRNRYFLVLILGLIAHSIHSQQLYEMSKGLVKFNSEAPLENIEAQAKEIKGFLNLDNQTFAFSLDVRSFTGFNNDLQREHFHENYMETEKIPKASFTGKLIDKFNPEVDFQKIRAKGQMDIHGVKKERIIDIVITRKGAIYEISSAFNISLQDHGISIPKIVFQKIAEVIKVDVSGTMILKK